MKISLLINLPILCQDSIDPQVRIGFLSTRQGLLHVKIFGVEHQHYQQNAKAHEIDRHSPRFLGWALCFHNIDNIVGWFFSATSDRGLVCLPVSASPTPWRVALTFYTTLRKASASFWCSAIWSSNQYSLDPRYNQTHVYIDIRLFTMLYSPRQKQPTPPHQLRNISHVCKCKLGHHPTRNSSVLAACVTCAKVATVLFLMWQQKQGRNSNQNRVHLGSRGCSPLNSSVHDEASKFSRPIAFFRPTACFSRFHRAWRFHGYNERSGNKNKSAQRDKVRTDVGVESDERQDVIACRICFFQLDSNFLPGTWRLEEAIKKKCWFWVFFLPVLRGKTT